MSATRTTQSQGGSDVSTTVASPTKSVSTRRVPERVNETTQEPVVNVTRQAATTARQVARPRVGCTISFSIKVLGNLPPITTPSS